MAFLKLNADMGESFGAWVMGQDDKVMPFVDLANIACGFHASDPQVMRKTVRLAKQHGVQVGAHPSYPDLVGFGRRSLACSPEEIENLVLYQVGALHAFCQAEGVSLAYIKPHGALYNDMVRDPQIFMAVLKAVRAWDQDLPLMTLATRDTSQASALAEEAGVTLWFEAFADRAYDAEGFLVSRREPGAVHQDADKILAQARCLTLGEPLTTLDGSSLTLAADTLCVHGDNDESIAAVKAIRQLLDDLEEQA
ncbi:UPF0271 protein [Marinospirillum celere]|uniref:5-oxoprolinase subunit A n=1 Tax=Marinospirillum celere TaxID=1122252 RepID=A0A1I1E8B1_9GAMM|nr:5-oxoprolinase subunit PxpA [Marinospirillum celere]SFB81558.1 UPF0271 protein [Marinospirillum celere]